MFDGQKNRPPVAPGVAAANEPKQEDTSLFTHALQYANRGLAVFPLMPRDKTPACANGFKAASTDTAVVKTLWAGRADRNIGIATGNASGFFVLDVDGEAGKASLAALISRHGDLPETLTSRTGKGQHLLFRMPEGKQVRNSQGRIGVGLDIRGDGGYIVAPPSLHPNGHTYQWADETVAIANAPDWLIDLLTPTPSTPREGQSAPFDSLRGPEEERKVRSMLASIDPDFYDDWVNVGMALRHDGWPLSLWDEWSRGSAKYKQGECSYKWKGFDRAGDTPLETRPISMGTLVHLARENGWKPMKPETSCGIICLEDIEAKPVEWLWPERIPLKLTVIAGNPGLGKSQITASLAAIVSTGGQWPDGSAVTNTGDVLILNAEDNAADTIKPRLLAAGADVRRCHVLEAVRVVGRNGKPDKIRGLNLSEDVEHLEEVLSSHPDIRLIVIDPISAYLGKIDSNNNSEIRGVLAPLAALADKHRVALLLVTHLNKSGSQEVMGRVIGSIGMVAAARATYAVMSDESPNRYFVPIKSNLGDDKTGFSFRVEGATLTGGIKTSRIAWQPGTVDAQKILNPEKGDSGREADNFLKEFLESGPVSSEEVFNAAKAVGIGKAKLSAAKKRLMVRVEKTGMTGGWIWRLPALPTFDAAEDAEDAEDAEESEESEESEEYG